MATRGKTPAKKAPPPKRDEAKNAVSDTDEEMRDLMLDGNRPSEMEGKEADEWIKQSGWSPVEYLTHVYRDPLQHPDRRVQAAKAVLDYAHRKLPAKIEVKGEVNTSNIVLDGVALSKLSDKELATLTALLEKIQ